MGGPNKDPGALSSPSPGPPLREGARGLGNWNGLFSTFFGLLVVTATAVIVLHGMVTHSAPLSLDAASDVSTTVLDRDGRLLRAFTTSSGHWRLPVAARDVDPRYLAMLTAFEDRRFYNHGGIDLSALARASLQLIVHRRIVSGGSTLTMQTARLIDGPHAKSGAIKLRQIVRALQLERTHTKAEILAIYLQLAPFGGNMEGVRAASIAYFGKEPRKLSLGQSALLVAIPQAPESRRPGRFPLAAQRARDRVLTTAFSTHVITASELARAKAEPIPWVRHDFPKLAPHLAEAERASTPRVAVLHTTLDADLQRTLETLAREHTKALGDKVSAAILVVENKSGEVLAHVGSAGYLDDARFGAIDMVNAVRSPGSTLKPIIYGLGFEAGLAHPEMLIEDRPVRFGTYAPKNFDEEFHGTVTIREALSQSLNIPAVKMLNAVGPGRLYGRFLRFGIAPQLPAKTEPSIAIALGGIGLTLHDLATLYTSLARGGESVTLHHRQASPNASGTSTINSPKALAVGPASRSAAHDAAKYRTANRRLLSPVASWYVTDILRNAPAPVSARSGQIAFKTGTSYGYRDAYAIGYDGMHTIAVWIGRPDSAATAGLTGRTAAAPLLFDAFARLGEHRTPFGAQPAGVVSVSAAQLPPPLKRFREPGFESNANSTFLEPAPVIAFPPDRSDVELDGELGAMLTVKADGGALPLTWLVDGQPIASEPSRHDAQWTPSGLGFAKLSVIDARGNVDRVTVRVR